MARRPRPADPATLEAAALHYLGRFASTAAQLRRVLMRRVAKSARLHGTDPEEGAGAVDRIVERFVAAGLVDDGTYAEARARTLSRRGDGAALIRAKLRHKGVAPELIDRALDSAGADSAEPGLAAALAL